MIAILILLIACVVECLPSPAKHERYRNVDGLVASAVILLISIIFDLYTAFSPILSYNNVALSIFWAAQAVIIVIVKLVSRHNDATVRYGIPPKYTTGMRYKIISLFYATEQKGRTIYTRSGVGQIGLVAVLGAVVLYITFAYQTYMYSSSASILYIPFYAGSLISFIIELAIFCFGESRWKKLVDRYNRRKGCKNRRELARVRFSSFTDFSYIFMKNFVWEPLHIMRATKFNWKDKAPECSIRFYDFNDRPTQANVSKEYTPELEEFITSNGLEVNELYVAAYNLINKNQNVLIKTPSYVEFEPYLISIIKMKVAKTQKVVLIVSNEEKKRLTAKKISDAFKEYMGFGEIPVMLTIDECVERMKKAGAEDDGDRQMSHFDELTSKGSIKIEPEDMLPIKSPDIIIAAPEDVCDPDYAEFLRKTVNKLGLIVYYDFSDSVQEEALFAKIVHAVLDYDDKISTLYMADGFFDLEQVVDNFFSKRNIYEIIVPRKPSRQSYVTCWKSENINEMQSRTFPDASRDIGNHIPILYDAGGHTENDFIVVEDELDTYAENRMSFSGNELADRIDYHVGWTDVIGGNSVMCTVSDTYNNVAHTYRAMSGVGSQSEYINIISRPYLLRNYLAYHLRFYTLYPHVLSSYSPGLIKTPRALAYEAVVKLFMVGCTKEQLLRYVESTSGECGSTADEMIRFLIGCAGGNADTVQITQNAHDRFFIDIRTYRDIIDESGLVEKVIFVTNRHEYIRNRRDYSYLIPQQKIVLDGVKYTVEKIHGNRVELTDSNTREPLYIVRPVRSCKVKVNDIESYGSRIQNNSNSSIGFRRLISDVELNTYGNIIYKDSYHPFCDEARYDYQTNDSCSTRSYSNVNVFNISIGSKHITSENRNRLSHLLALLLNEMLPTFFPRHSGRIVIGCSGWNIDSNSDDRTVTTLYTVAQTEIEGAQCKDNEINLYILEDSPIETGLVNVFWQDEEFKYMLRVLEDYLYYLKIINRREMRETFAESYTKDLYLLRRILLEVINESQELENDNKEIEVGYYNKIRRSRNKFNRIEITDFFDITCDFCGKKIESKYANSLKYHYYSYSGIVSCLDCYESAVHAGEYSQRDIDVRKKIVNKWFMRKYKDSVTTQFYNYLEDVERVLEISSIKDRLIVTDDHDYGIVSGLASTGIYGDDIAAFANEEFIPITAEMVHPNDGFDDYARASYTVEDLGRAFILIRDGLPAKEYMGVLTHEMTHQWQFANLDFTRLCLGAPINYSNEFEKGEDLHNFRIEGMAEWERIRYIRENVGWLAAHREASALRSTRNAYGYGYVWMCNFIKVGHDDPSIPVNRTLRFILLRNYYQLTKNSFALMSLYFGKDQDKGSNSGENTDSSQ